jgi:intracellular septation protein
MTEKPQLNPTIKLVLDLGPLLVFGATYFFFDLYTATAVLMGAALVAAAVAFALTRHLTKLQIWTTIAIMVFGTLTLVLHDKLFIQVKATVFYVVLAGVLLGGLAAGKPVLGVVFDSVLHLTEEGWRKLTLRLGLFFLALALMNEVVRNTQTEAVWVSFKVFGLPLLTILFFAAQVPLISRYTVPEPAE